MKFVVEACSNSRFFETFPFPTFDWSWSIFRSFIVN